MIDKRARRRELFGRLKALDEKEKTNFSHQIVQHLATLPCLVRGYTLFSYAAMASEPDLAELRQRFSEKQWGLSRVSDDGLALQFYEVASDESLQRSPYGFLEPNPSTCSILEAPDLVLIPGVGFDPDTMMRLGRGKGHYDRFLEPLLASPNPPLLVGVCFSTQLGSVPHEAHDVPMDFIVTEEGVIEA